MRTYSVIMDDVSVSAAQDLIRLSAAADTVLLLLRASITQQGSTKSDNILGHLYRASDNGTGTSYTSLPYDPGDAAFGGTAVVDLSADTTKSPATPLHAEGWNVFNGWLWIPKDQEIIIVPGQGRIVLRLDDAPTAATNLTAQLVFGELG